MGVKAEVLSVSADHQVTLKAGMMTITVKEDDVLLLEGKEAERPKMRKSPPKQAQTQLRTASVSSELDIRGMECLEGVNTAENYLDSAVMAKISPVRIIHGKGTGALRTAIHQMLKRNKHVKSYRLGVFGEGESGVTVVELK